MISRHPGAFMLAMALICSILLIGLVFQDNAPVAGDAELSTMQRLLDMALAHAKLGEQAKSVSEAKFEAQSIVNLVEGQGGRYFVDLSKIGKVLNASLKTTPLDDYGIRHYAVDFMMAIQEPQVKRMLNHYAVQKGNERASSGMVMAAADSVLIGMYNGESDALLVLGIKDKERIQGLFRMMENFFQRAIGKSEDGTLLDTGVLSIQKTLDDASGEK
ncbi:hypothetical protein HY229_01670 [Candidatus Acetothermia bacterium]|nr:hypothetical protein [Candidatus Acetothermia bacterium]MBI3642798.1 hypothetical protein [Candidatus Acetothermia bacterium]